MLNWKLLIMKTKEKNKIKLNALKKVIETDDPISTYKEYAEWLASKSQGALYLQQAIWYLAYTLANTGDKQEMQRATNNVLEAERISHNKFNNAS